MSNEHRERANPREIAEKLFEEINLEGTDPKQVLTELAALIEKEEENKLRKAVIEKKLPDDDEVVLTEQNRDSWYRFIGDFEDALRNISLADEKKIDEIFNLDLRELYSECPNKISIFDGTATYIKPYFFTNPLALAKKIYNYIQTELTTPAENSQEDTEAKKYLRETDLDELEKKHTSVVTKGHRAFGVSNPDWQRNRGLVAQVENDFLGGIIIQWKRFKDTNDWTGAISARRAVEIAKKIQDFVDKYPELQQ